MSITRNIIRNKKLEPILLDYMKYALLLHSLEDKPQNIEEAIAELQILEGSEYTEHKLYKSLNEYFGLNINNVNCSHPTYKIVVKGCQYYQKKYGLEKILIRETMFIDNLVYQKAIKRLIPAFASCQKCGGEREFVKYSQLPKHAQEAFKEYKEKSLLYCEKCAEWGLVQEDF